MKTEIRPMLVEDAEVVMFLSQQLGYAVSVIETITNIKQALKTPDHLLLVATYNAKVIGWIHAFKAIYIESQPFIEIGGLVVDENYRGKGVGKALINEVKNWCLQKEVYSLRLRTNSKRTEAHQFYQHLGFLEIKQQKVYQMKLTK